LRVLHLIEPLAFKIRPRGQQAGDALEILYEVVAMRAEARGPQQLDGFTRRGGAILLEQSTRDRDRGLDFVFQFLFPRCIKRGIELV